MNKYVIYARKSSEAEDRQALSIDSQIHELQDFAKRQHIKISEVITESQSAKDPGRPEFNRLMNMVYSGEVNGIVCWKLDRLARNSVDGGAIIYAINKNNLNIITPSQTYNQQYENSFMMYVEFGMAQKYVDDLSKNVKRGLKAKAEKGWLPSGAKPGYMNDKYADKGNKTILSDPDRFPLIRKAWDLMLTGTFSPPAILEKLNKEWGYRTPIRKSLGGKPMARSHIYRMFTDPFYYGEFEYPVKSGNWRTGKHEAMITREEFDRVQMLLGKKGRPRPHTRTFKYTGMLRCGECGAQITAEYKEQIICPNCKNKFASMHRTECPHCQTAIVNMINPTYCRYTYYHCTKMKDPNCTQGVIEEKKLEEQIDAYLQKIQISERFKDWAIKQLNQMHDTESTDRTAITNNLQHAYNDVVKRIDNLVKLKISPQNTNGELLSDDEFKSQKDSLMKEKLSLQEKMRDTEARVDQWVELSTKTFELACYARYWYANGDADTKRQILSSLSTKLTLKDKTVHIDVEKPFQVLEVTVENEPTITPILETKMEIVPTGYYEGLWSQNFALLPR